MGHLIGYILVIGVVVVFGVLALGPQKVSPHYPRHLLWNAYVSADKHASAELEVVEGWLKYHQNDQKVKAGEEVLKSLDLAISQTRLGLNDLIALRRELGNPQ